MRDWRKIELRSIHVEKDENGSPFLNSFLRDYKTVSGATDINASCERCLKDYYLILIKYLNKMGTSEKKESKFKLKLMYNGIHLKFGSGILVTNATITDEQGEYLLKNHPKGEGLFDKVGEPKPKADKDLKKDELIEKYPAIDPKLNKKDFLKAVKEAEDSAE